jgi:hypothetical protein
MTSAEIMQFYRVNDRCYELNRASYERELNLISQGDLSDDFGQNKYYEYCSTVVNQKRNGNYRIIESGKWIFWPSMNDRDNFWNNLCNLYKNNELIGVTSMKRSMDKRMICVYCGPYNNTQHLTTVLNNLLRQIDYNTDIYGIGYKPDYMTELENGRFRHPKRWEKKTLLWFRL